MPSVNVIKEKRLMSEIELNTIYNEDCLEAALMMPDKSISCIVTSPPYWGLRDYGTDGQYGLEETPEEYVTNLVKLFRELKRALKDDGVVWINIGDSYVSSRPKGTSGNGTFSGKVSKRYADFDFGRSGKTSRVGEKLNSKKGRGKQVQGLKMKELIGIPWKVAFALQADGWYLRQDIIWNKPNPMPESVIDRCTKSHEYVFMLTKKAKYYFDNEAIKEDTVNGLAKKNRRSVWNVPLKPYKEAHFATYPKKLIEPMILASSRKGDIVYDPFMGAGTTAVVAKELGRNYIGSEISKEYCEIATKRIEEQN
jgi:DNA modification methylase